MKYQIIYLENRNIVAEAKRINDSFLVQETRSMLSGGWFDNGSVKIFRDGEEIDPELVLGRDERRFDVWFAKKSETHKQVYMAGGVCCLGQNRIKIWIKK